MEQPDQTKQIAVAIFVGFALVAGAIYFGNTEGREAAGQLANQRPQEIDSGIDARRAPEQGRNIYGNPEAPITIVEFSDFECPYCSQLHGTLEQIVADYDGEVSWEYRHLPLPSHAGAVPAAVASECVARLAGNDAFWSYTKDIFDNQRGVSEDFLKTTALSYEISAENYDNCVAAEEVSELVTLDLEAARALGGGGTPYSIIRYADGTQRAVSGALPYTHWRSLLSQ